jgi:hypothetical protein
MSNNGVSSAGDSDDAGRAGGSADADLSVAMGSAMVACKWQQAYLWEIPCKIAHLTGLAALRHYGIAVFAPDL